jgi:gliding motility-associated-like protein
MKTKNIIVKYSPILLLSILFNIFNLSSTAQKAEFSISDSIGCDEVTVVFTNESTGGINKWAWDFGNGAPISTEKNPTMYYKPGNGKPGIYNVTLIGYIGTTPVDTITKLALIKVYNNPKVFFEVDKTSGCFPLEVNFTDKSMLGDTALVSWIWDFGDGKNSNEQNPNYTYENPGVNATSLIITDLNGCIATTPLTEKITINVEANDLVANFTIDKPEGCTIPHEVNFSNSTTGKVSEWNWNYGNGQTSTDSIPTIQTYNTIGVFPVTLSIKNLAGCVDTIIKNITIEQHYSSFTADTTNGCSPLKVQFTDNSTQATSWEWFVDDVSKSKIQNPELTFTNAGEHIVKLTSKKGNCSDDSTMVISVFANPIPVFTASDVDACKVPFDVTFYPDTSGIESYKWTFEKYGTSIEDTAFVSYLAEGKYDVKLAVVDTNGCSGTTNKADYIKIDFPNAKFTLGVKDKGCTPLDVNFTDLSKSNEQIVKWTWIYGDNKTDIVNFPTILHQYTDTGSFDVKLIIENIEGCKDSLTKQDTVLVGDHQIVDFSPSGVSVCYNATQKFEDLSTDLNGKKVADEWLWTFGELGTATTKDPTHKFTGSDNIGDIFVELKVGFHGCYDSLKIDNYAHVDAPIAKFDIDKPIFCQEELPYEANFTNTSIDDDNYLWNFNDGSPTEATEHSSHIFTTAGTHTIELIVENIATTCKDTVTHDIIISSITPDFTSSKIVGCSPFNSIFHNTTISNQVIKNYLWSYSDGTFGKDAIEVDRDFSNSTAISKFYDVKLLVVDNLNCKDSITKVIDVNPIPTIDFVSDDLTGCVPFNTTFSDISVTESPINKWKWYFTNSSNKVDSLESFDKDTSFTFSPKGKYSVKLKATDTQGCVGDTTKTNYVSATFPTANFTVAPVVCDSVLTTFTSTSDSTFVGDKLTYKWDFGDTSPILTTQGKLAKHLYNSLADTSISFTAKLTVLDMNLCEASISKNVTISIVEAGFFPSGILGTCPPFPVTFTDTSKSTPGIVNAWEWDFGDFITSKFQNPYHPYESAGTFGVKLIATNEYGCSDEAKIDSLITVGGPLGSFTWDIKYEDENGVPSCVPWVNFSAITDEANTVKWIYGDGKSNFNNNKNPKYQYLKPDCYEPVLLIYSSVCKSTYVAPTPVCVTFPLITSELKELTSAICKNNGGSAEFISATGGTPKYTYLWNNDNKDTSKIATGLYAGYTEIIVTDSVGCMGLDSVLIQTIPNDIKYTSVETPAICIKPLGKSVLKPYNGTAPYTFKWQDNLSNVDSIMNVLNNDYYFTITDVNGCEKIDFVTIGVEYLNISDNPTIKPALCNENNGKITLSPTGGIKPYSYKWSNTSESTLNDSINSDLAPSTSVSDYNVTITDNYGCVFNNINPYIIEMQDNEFIKADFSFTPNNVIGGDTISFTDLSTNIYEITNWKWYIEDAVIDDTITSFTHIFYNGGYYDVKLLITDEYGCQDDTTLTVTIKPGLEKPNVFTPNGDGKNDYFTIIASGIEEFSIEIFNRWGAIVYKETSPYINWAGKTTAGVDVPIGTYFYILKAKGIDGKNYDDKGFITLIR